MKKCCGFTLIEILIAMSVMVVGLVGILSLFPVALNANRQASEDTQAALIAESVYASLRAAAQRTEPNKTMRFFYDGIEKSNNEFPKDPTPSTDDYKFNETLRDHTFGIPKHRSKQTPVVTDGRPIPIMYSGEFNYVAELPTAQNPGDYCRIGQSTEGDGSIPEYNIPVSRDDERQMRQYSFNIQISYPNTNPKSLYDVVIRIARNDRLIKKFYTQLMIPTGD